MSAVPRRRPGPGCAPPRVVLGDGPSPADAEFYGLVPAGPIAISDKLLSDRAKVVVTALCVLARGSHTWVQASVEEIAVAAGFSARKAAKGLAELAEARIIEWESIGRRFRVLFRLRGRDDGDTPPAPFIAPAPAPAPECAPVCVPKRVPVSVPKRVAESPPLSTPVLVRDQKDDERPACAGESSSFESRREEPTRTEGVVHEPDYNPHAPLDEPGDQATEDEIHEDLARRVMDLFGAVNRHQLREDIREHGEIALDVALDICERMPEPPRGYGYVRGILKNQRAEQPEIGRAKTRSERFPAAKMQNYNPGPDEPVRPATGQERAAWRDWRASFRAINGDPPPPVREKIPAAGPHANVPPPPAAGISVHRTSESYPSEGGSASPSTGNRTPHHAVRDASPQKVANPASTNQLGPGIPAKPGPSVMHGSITSHQYGSIDPIGAVPVPPGPRKPDPGGRIRRPAAERARQDSNLQPSDSKSAGLPFGLSGSVDATGRSGDPPSSNPHPVSDWAQYGPGERRGFIVRGPMRC
jgi:hypothetical protein